MMLNVDNINVYYGQIHALKDVSLEVKEGEIVALIGITRNFRTASFKNRIYFAYG